MIGDLRRTSELEDARMLLSVFTPTLAAAAIDPRQPAISMDDADAQHAVLRLVGGKWPERATYTVRR